MPPRGIWTVSRPAAPCTAFDLKRSARASSARGLLSRTSFLGAEVGRVAEGNAGVVVTCSKLERKPMADAPPAATPFAIPRASEAGGRSKSVRYRLLPRGLRGSRGGLWPNPTYLHLPWPRATWLRRRRRCDGGGGAAGRACGERCYRHHPSAGLDRARNGRLQDALRAGEQRLRQPRRGPAWQQTPFVPGHVAPCRPGGVVRYQPGLTMRPLMGGLMVPWPDRSRGSSLPRAGGRRRCESAQSSSCLYGHARARTDGWPTESGRCVCWARQPGVGSP